MLNSLPLVTAQLGHNVIHTGETSHLHFWQSLIIFWKKYLMEGKGELFTLCSCSHILVHYKSALSFGSAIGGDCLLN